MIYLSYPWALALLLPIAIAYWIWARMHRGQWWRLFLLFLLVFALSGPYVSNGAGGSDVVLILDRSESMRMHFEEQERLAQLVAEQRGANDRLAIICVGAGTHILQGPQSQGLKRLIDTHVEAYASDLRAGIEQALAIIPPERSARIILHSDGAYTDRNPRILASSFQARRIPIDFYQTNQPGISDAAIMDVELPLQLRLGESFIGAVQFWSDKTEQRKYEIKRDQKIVAQGSVQLHAMQETTIHFADRPLHGGVNNYTVLLDAQQDKQTGNNKARAVLRVESGEHVLVMSGDGSPGNVHRALESAGINVSSIAEGSVNIEQLSAYSVLILDQVPATRLGHNGMESIKTWVKKLGGGLVMLGGKRSFGAGGYHRSPVEEVLPVSMELRDEHRKLSVAMAITLDRSGSMAATVPGGLTKMDLANQGAIAAIDLLGPNDSVAVHAVDSAPHIIIPMTRLNNPGPITKKVSKIGSMGGGIYVYEALVAAGKELLDAEQATKHLILFADAADAEQPGQYKQLLQDYQQASITVSVIGLGSDKDSDAAFLKDVAARGGGRVHFTTVPKDIPRLFAQETVLIARSSWINEVTPLQAHAHLNLLIGQQSVFENTWPQANGYNLCYLKGDADEYVRCAGDPSAPGIAAWRIGAGRSIAIPFAIDDSTNAALIGWPGYAPLLASLVRWCAESQAQDLGLLRAQRFGDRLHVQLELDPLQKESWPLHIAQMDLVNSNPEQPDQRLQLEPVDDGLFEAQIHLRREHAYIPVLQLGDDALLGPAVCLPYSPEEKPQIVDRSADIKQLARNSGGVLRNDVIDVFELPPSPGARWDLSTLLICLALACLILEIAWRRLHIRIGGKKKTPVQTHVDSQTPLALSADTTEQQATVETENKTGPGRDQGLHEALRQLKKRR